MRVAVQGFGNVGSYLAKLLHQEGATVVAISDSSDALLQREGHRRRRRRSRTSASTARSRACDDAEAITNDELLLLDVDILAPCALEQVITEQNADRVKASIICEGANGPITPGADAILEDKGVLILPDVLANAGGVVVSYFEWVQGLQEYFWKESEVNAKLNDIVSRAFEETWETAQRRKRADAGRRVRRSPSSASPRRRSPAASTRSRRGRRLPRRGLPPLRAGARRRCGRSRRARLRAARGRHHAATRRSRPSTASGSRSSRSTAGGASRTTSRSTRSAVRLHKRRPSRSCYNGPRCYKLDG